jgi:hypothetical protein
MKKAIAIIILGLLWCNVGFAKSFKLNCSFKDAYVTMDDGSTKKLTPDSDIYQIYSADAVISVNEDLEMFDGLRADRFDDEIMKVEMRDELKGPKATIKMKKIWTINRITGVFTKEIYSKLVGRDTSWGNSDTIRYDCRKAKKKF